MVVLVIMVNSRIWLLFHVFHSSLGFGLNYGVLYWLSMCGKTFHGGGLFFHRIVGSFIATSCIQYVRKLRRGVNQLLPCLNKYGSFKLFVETLNDDHNNAGK